LKDSANKRTDEYGGSIENKSRFALELVDGVIDIFGTQRTGIKLSPNHSYHSISDSNPTPLAQYLVKELDKKKISHIEIMENFSVMPDDDELRAKYFEKTTEKSFREVVRPLYKGTLIGNHKLT